MRKIQFTNNLRRGYSPRYFRPDPTILNRRKPKPVKARFTLSMDIARFKRWLRPCYWGDIYNSDTQERFTWSGHPNEEARFLQYLESFKVAKTTSFSQYKRRGGLDI